MCVHGNWTAYWSDERVQVAEDRLEIGMIESACVRDVDNGTIMGIAAYAREELAQFVQRVRHGTHRGATATSGKHRRE